MGGGRGENIEFFSEIVEKCVKNGEADFVFRNHFYEKIFVDDVSGGTGRGKFWMVDRKMHKNLRKKNWWTE